MGGLRFFRLQYVAIWLCYTPFYKLRDLCLLKPSNTQPSGDRPSKTRWVLAYSKPIQDCALQ